MTIGEKLRYEFPKRSVTYYHYVYITMDGRIIDEITLGSEGENASGASLEDCIKTLKNRLGMMDVAV